MATASDAFTRADAATLGANWTMAKGMSGRLGILSNAVKDTDGTANRIGDYYSTTSFGADQVSQATFPNITADAQFVTVRNITSGTVRNFYGGGHDKNDNGNFKYCLVKFAAGVESVLATHASQVATAGDVVRLEIAGTTLTLFVNGVQILQTTDASLSVGQPGLMLDSLSNMTAYFDDWSGGDLAAAVTPVGGSLSLLGVG